MLPAALVELENLPLTATGKVDRSALSAPDRSHRIHLTDHVAPQTPFEKLIAEIWGKILQVEPIGVHDNFFELGGHSLLATQVVVRLRTMLKVPVSLRTLFDFPTIAQLAQRLEESSTTLKND